MRRAKLQTVGVLLLSAFIAMVGSAQKPVCNKILNDTLWLCQGTKVLFNKQIKLVVNDTFVVNPLKKGYRIYEDPYREASAFYDSLKSAASSNVFTATLYNALFPGPDTIGTDLQKVKLPSKADSDFQPYQGKLIRRIVIKRFEVFGPTLANPKGEPETWLGRLGNTLQVNTHVDVIRKNLLFKEGDNVEPLRLAENAQILRALPYFAELNLVVAPVFGSDDLVDVFVMAKDVFAYGFELGIVNASIYDVSLFNNNFLGRGNKVNFTFRANTAESPFMLVNNLNYSIGNIKGTFFNAAINYLHTNYLHSTALKFERDFYATNARYAGGIALANTIETKGVFYPSYVQNQIIYNTQRLWLGKPIPLLPSSIFKQLVVSASLDNKQFMQRPYTTASLNSLYYNSSQKLLSISLSSNAYYNSNYVYRFGATEDIPYGSLLELTLGPESYEYYNRFYYGLRFAKARYFNGLGYFSGSLVATGYSANDLFEQAQFGARLDYFSDLYTEGIYKIRYFLTGNYRLGINRLAGESLNVVEELGVVGLGSSDTIHFSGTKKLTFNYTALVYTPVYFYGFKLAVVNYANLALFGAADKLAFSNKLLTGFGVGVLLRNENLVIKTLQLRLGYYPGIPGGGSGLQFEIRGISLLEFLDFKPKPPRVIRYK